MPRSTKDCIAEVEYELESSDLRESYSDTEASAQDIFKDINVSLREAENFARESDTQMVYSRLAEVCAMCIIIMEKCGD